MNTTALDKIEMNSIEPMVIKVDNGLDEDKRKRIASGLAKLLSDSYYLLLKTHNYHWNVRGAMFFTIHNMTEEQYNELFPAIDVIAERIRSLGFFAPGRFDAFGQITSINEGDYHKNQEEMVADLIKSNEAVVKTARKIIETCEDLGDSVTADMVSERVEQHDKNAWMLRSLLEK